MRNKEPNRNVYVGHRYVPLILEEWDKKISYEGLSVVTHKGASYTSKKRVPVGIDILNKEFWSLTGNYNAQVDYYRQETERVSQALETKADKEELNNFKVDINNDFNLFKGETDSTISAFKSDINSDVDSFKGETDNTISDFKSDINSDVTLFKNQTDNTISDFKSDINSDVTLFKNQTDNTISDFKSDINNDFELFKGETDDQVNTYKEDIFIQKNNLETYNLNSKVTPKAIYNIGGHTFITTQKANGKGYIRFRLRDDIFSSNQSVGYTAQLLRIVEVLSVTDAIVMQHNETSNNNSEDWANSSVAFKGTQMKLKTTNNNTVGNWIEYNIDTPPNITHTNILVRCSNGSSDNVEVKVNGEVTKELSFKGEGFKWFSIPVNQESNTIRLTTVNSGYMSIAGVNAINLNSYVDGHSFDEVFTAIQTSTNQYIVNNGSMDYAMVEAETNLYSGSYHGGETRNRLLITVDNETIDLNDGDIFVGETIEIEQDTRIVNKVDSFTRQVFKQDGSRAIDVIFDGDINLTLLFTNMTTTSNEYTDVIYPNRIKITEDGNYYLNKGANHVIQRNPDNNQKIITIMNNNIFPVGDFGRSPYIKGSANSLYNKLYKANIDSDTPVNFTGGTFRTVHIFE